MDIRQTLAKALLENELSGNLAFAYKFSDADGIHSGKSGYSFGRCQIDINNNPAGKRILAEIGFTTAEIASLLAQTVPLSVLAVFNARLQTPAGKAIIDAADNAELDAAISHTVEVCANAGLHLADDETFIHLADYHNQFHLDHNGKCVTWLKRLGRPIGSADILDYKLTTLWGSKRPDDVARRWNNIHCICAGR